jgi:hypothetical protein
MASSLSVSGSPIRGRRSNLPVSPNWFDFMWYVLVLLVALLSAKPAAAASIERQSLGPGLPDVILVYGELTLSDIQQFRTVAGATSNAVVALAGPGGSVIAGLTIGEIIRLRNFETAVLDQAYCASACALAWLGGAKRFMGSTAQIGFHAAWNAQSGDVSGAGNALVGAYLNKIGMSPSAIVYITAAAPSSMKWLTFNDAKLYGIDVDFLAGQSSTPPPTSSANQSRSPLELAAIEFVQTHAAAESAQATESVETVRTHYSDTIFYYGKYLSKAAVIQQYQTFVERWPQGDYQVRPNSIDVECFPGSQVCNVKAIIDWVAISRPRGKKSEGESSWSLGLLKQGGSFVITSVNGTVLKRRISNVGDEIQLRSPGRQSEMGTAKADGYFDDYRPKRDALWPSYIDNHDNPPVSVLEQRPPPAFCDVAKNHRLCR